MQSNSQGRRDRPDTKAVLKSDLTDSSIKSGSVDKTSPVEAMKNFVPGVVTDCVRLNVRKTPSLDGDVLTVVDFFSEVVVNLEDSTDDFYKVCTATGVEGFCMKKYIAISR